MGDRDGRGVKNLYERRCAVRGRNRTSTLVTLSRVSRSNSRTLELAHAPPSIYRDRYLYRSLCLYHVPAEKKSSSLGHFCLRQESSSTSEERPPQAVISHRSLVQATYCFFPSGTFHWVVRARIRRRSFCSALAIRRSRAWNISSS